MKPQYEPKTMEQFLGYIVEECGEVLHVVGKSQRWGLDSFNPEIPTHERESNFMWLKRELMDLRGAIDRLEMAMDRYSENGDVEL